MQSIYPPGIDNLGNTCYMNATLQCFRAVPELRSALRAYDFYLVVSHHPNCSPSSYTGMPSMNDLSASVTASLRDLYSQMEGTNKAAQPLVFLTVSSRHCYLSFNNLKPHRFCEGHFPNLHNKLRMEDLCNKTRKSVGHN